MKYTRLLVHYLNRLSSNPNTSYCRQRLSVLKAQIQRSTTRNYEKNLANLLAIRQRLAQWPLSVSHYNRLASLALAHQSAGGNGTGPGHPWQLRDRVSLLYVDGSKVNKCSFKCHWFSCKPDIYDSNEGYLFRAWTTLEMHWASGRRGYKRLIDDYRRKKRT